MSGLAYAEVDPRRRDGYQISGRRYRQAWTWGFILLATGAIVACDSGGGSGDGTSSIPEVCALTWNANKETAVNTTGGVYRIYYSSTPGATRSDPHIDVPYTQTSLTIASSEGTPYTCQSYYAVTAVPANPGAFPESSLSVEVGGL